MEAGAKAKGAGGPTDASGGDKVEGVPEVGLLESGEDNGSEARDEGDEGDAKVGFVGDGVVGACVKHHAVGGEDEGHALEGAFESGDMLEDVDGVDQIELAMGGGGEGFGGEVEAGKADYGGV